MKLIVQIPCLNEEHGLSKVLESIPSKINGVSEILVVVLDDGSSDSSVAIAELFGAVVVRSASNRGLAKTFLTGLKVSYEHGADIVVNLDGDFQYDGREIPLLIEPVLRGRADVVLGVRPLNRVPHFTWHKKALHQLGNRAINILLGRSFRDITTGFRAFSRHAASILTVKGSYTYTIETAIQAGEEGLVVAEVPVSVNAVIRPSRLIRSTPQYLIKAAETICQLCREYPRLRSRVLRISIIIIVVVLLLLLAVSVVGILLSYSRL